MTQEQENNRLPSIGSWWPETNKEPAARPVAEARACTQTFVLKSATNDFQANDPSLGADWHISLREIAGSAATHLRDMELWYSLYYFPVGRERQSILFEHWMEVSKPHKQSASDSYDVFISPHHKSYKQSAEQFVIELEAFNDGGKLIASVPTSQASLSPEMQQLLADAAGNEALRKASTDFYAQRERETSMTATQRYAEAKRQLREQQ
jgi:hypothetical protein